MRLKTENIEQIPVFTRTGGHFDRLVMATVWCKDGSKYDVLFDKDERIINNHPKLKALEQFFNKAFMPGKIDETDCLINKV